MNTQEFTLGRLTSDLTLPAFDCGDADLNSFLANDAAAYQRERFTVTHLLYCKADDDNLLLAGYFCLLTDKLVFDPSDEEQRKQWKVFNKLNRIHFNKHRKMYPSIKIGRLAIDLAFAGKGLGRYLMNRIINIVLSIEDIGCRFITVDAYKNAFDFYLKNDFRFLSDEDADDETRVMYFDIKRFAA
ncbi:MAG: GNAT family N-acetyltransferase [Tannerella sp.]|jgi:GNAT superfamily N-acetyltransferase|nr:GNAT family N-acetyltransferase [Tannerella sp.]